MLSEVIIYKLNEDFDWIIRKQLFNLLPESLHHPYLYLQFLLLLFGIVNIFIAPIIGAIVSIFRKDVFAVVISFLAALAYYLLLRQLGDGII
jgi:hypothetical protein